MTCIDLRRTRSKELLRDQLRRFSSLVNWQSSRVVRLQTLTTVMIQGGENQLYFRHKACRSGSFVGDETYTSPRLQVRQEARYSTEPRDPHFDIETPTQRSHRGNLREVKARLLPRCHRYETLTTPKSY